MRVSVRNGFCGRGNDTFICIGDRIPVQAAASRSSRPNMSVFRQHRISLMFILAFLYLFPHTVCAAWQEIAAYTDCGSTNFQTQKILVDFDMDTYWLNISILGQFTTTVVESDLTTLRYSMLTFKIPASDTTLMPSYPHYGCFISSESNLHQFFCFLQQPATVVTKCYIPNLPAAARILCVWSGCSPC